MELVVPQSRVEIAQAMQLKLQEPVQNRTEQIVDVPSLPDHHVQEEMVEVAKIILQQEQIGGALALQAAEESHEIVQILSTDLFFWFVRLVLEAFSRNTTKRILEVVRLVPRERIQQGPLSKLGTCQDVNIWAKSISVSSSLYTSTCRCTSSYAHAATSTYTC